MLPEKEVNHHVLSVEKDFIKISYCMYLKYQKSTFMECSRDEFRF